jgi:hypothetical protein
MTLNHDLERRLHDYYATEPALRAPDRVLASVLTTIDITPQRRGLRLGPWRLPSMNALWKPAVASIAIVIVAIAALAIGLRDGDGVGTEPTPAPTSTAAPSGAATPIVTPSLAPAGLPGGGLPLDPARYRIDVPGSAVVVELTVAEPGWQGNDWFISNSSGSLSFWAVGNVYADGCDPSSVPDPPTGPSVDEFIEALDAQVNTDLELVGNPSVGGYPSTQVIMRQPPTGTDCLGVGPPRMWQAADGGDGRAVDDQPDMVWAVDAGGSRVVIVGFYDQGDPSADDAILEMIDSIEFIVP